MTEDGKEGKHHLLEAAQLAAAGQESAVPGHQPGEEVPEPGSSTAGLGLLAKVAVELEEEGAGEILHPLEVVAEISYVLEALEKAKELGPQVLPCLAQLLEEAEEGGPQVLPCLAQLLEEAEEGLAQVEPLLAELLKLVKEMRMRKEEDP